MELGSVEPVLEELKPAVVLTGHSDDNSTVFLECGLKPSAFVDRIPKGSEERDNWTCVQRKKAEGKKRVFETNTTGWKKNNLFPMGT